MYQKRSKNLCLQEEFLLNAPGDLGMCITTEGMSSDRPPIQWIKPVSKFVFCHPHIVALTSTKDTVMVYRYVVTLILHFILGLFLLSHSVSDFKHSYKATEIVHSIIFLLRILL